MNTAGSVGRSVWHRLAAAHDAVTSASFGAAAAVLAGIALSFCYEVAARYFFAAPTSWANALVSYLLCAAIFLAVPELTRRRAHIAINLLVDHVPRNVAGMLHTLIRAAGAAACLLATWISGNETLSQINQGITTISAYPIPKWWVSVFIPYGMASAGLYFLRDLIGRDIRSPQGSAEGITP
jgi:TRAP-type C4-dicarboxylate transport system permease small subunit